MVRTLRLFEPRREAKPRQRENRENRHERGYDYDWSVVSARHLRKFPLCVECERAGKTVLADVVDHKIPVKDRPDLRLDPANHWGLCNFCHNGMKRRLEGYARAANKIDDLMRWCDEPTSRPKALKFDRRRPKETMIV